MRVVALGCSIPGTTLSQAKGTDILPALVQDKREAAHRARARAFLDPDIVTSVLEATVKLLKHRKASKGAIVARCGCCGVITMSASSNDHVHPHGTVGRCGTSDVLVLTIQSMSCARR